MLGVSSSNVLGLLRHEGSTALDSIDVSLHIYLVVCDLEEPSS